MKLPARPGLYFHTYWTRPQTDGLGTADDPDLVLPDFEALTWLVSALEARRHGRIRLITDRRGLQFIRNIGLEWVYDAGVSAELDDIPATLDPRVFWSAGKLFAWQSITEPAVSLDPDAICWEPVAADAPVIALHTEELESADYAFQRQRYARFGFDGPEWNWTDEPINAGILCLNDLEFARNYAGESIRFMLDFSRELHDRPQERGSKVEAWSDAMLFAEQRLIVLLMRKYGLTGASLAQFDPRRRHLAPNSSYLHLWGTKRFYPRCRAARAAYVNFLIAHVGKAFPEAMPTLRRWQLDRPVDVESLPPDPENPFPLRDIREAHCRIGRIHGSLYVQDGNLPALRKVEPGAAVGHAETLCPDPGTTFELTEVRFEHDPNLVIRSS